MTIVGKFPDNMSGKDLYKMTKDARIQKMRDAANSTLEIVAWVYYTDVDDKGKEHDVVSIRDKLTGLVYATNSPTFCRTFKEILDILTDAGEALETLDVIEGTSKGGRTFITCGL